MIDEQRYRALIQQLATGGITGNKTYHQYHDHFVPSDSEGVAIQKLAIGGNVQKKTAYDPRATTSDMADALRMSGGGSDAQKMQDLQRYNLNTQAPLQKGVMEQMLEKPDVAPYADNYNKPFGTLEEYMSGYADYSANNPNKYTGTAAIVPAMLPGGHRYDFSSSGHANHFNDYLESIGQLPFRRYTDESMIKKFPSLSSTVKSST